MILGYFARKQNHHMYPSVQEVQRPDFFLLSLNFPGAGYGYK